MISNSCSACKVEFKLLYPEDNRGLLIKRNYPEYDDYALSEFFKNEELRYSDFLCEALKDISSKEIYINEDKFHLIESFCNQQKEYLRKSDELQSGTYGFRLESFKKLENNFIENEKKLCKLIKSLQLTQKSL